MCLSIPLICSSVLCTPAMLLILLQMHFPSCPNYYRDHDQADCMKICMNINQCLWNNSQPIFIWHMHSDDRIIYLMWYWISQRHGCCHCRQIAHITYHDQMIPTPLTHKLLNELNLSQLKSYQNFGNVERNLAEDYINVAIVKSAQELFGGDWLWQKEFKKLLHTFSKYLKVFARRWRQLTLLWRRFAMSWRKLSGIRWLPVAYTLQSPSHLNVLGHLSLPHLVDSTHCEFIRRFFIFHFIYIQ